MLTGSLPRWLKTGTGGRECDFFTMTSKGRGKDVVLVHGLAASPDTWDGAAGRLSPDVRLHLPHVRGFAGLPPATNRDPVSFLKPLADDLAAYIRSSIQRPIPLAGHSMGGIVALIIARDHPDVIERVLVVDVPAFFSVLVNPFATRASMSFLAQLSRRTYIEKTQQQLEDDLHRASARLVSHPRDRERLVRWGLASDRATIADVMAEVMVTDLRGDLSNIRAPVDVVYGWARVDQPSPLVLDKTYSVAYAGLIQGRMVRIDDARHYIMIDQPGAFYAAMNDWLVR